MKTSNKKVNWLVLLVGLLFFASCASQPENTAHDPAGFFWGLFHGFTIVFSFIGGIFTDIRIYEFPNTGGWYDFGYLIGVVTFVGSTGS